MCARLDAFTDSTNPINNDGTQPFPIIVDNGASLCCTPSFADFLTFTATIGQLLSGIATDLDTAGVCLLSWTIIDDSRSVREMKVQGA